MKSFFRLTGFIALAVWIAIFVVDWIPYTEGSRKDGKCYSPNHQYYIKRYLTPFRAAFKRGLDPIGVAILYDKDGEILYAGETLFSTVAGPFWGVNSVDFIGATESAFRPGWDATLPDLAAERPTPGCY